MQGNVVMNDTRIPVRNDAYTLENFDGEVLLYSTADTKAVYLNETAFLVYGMCDAERSIGEIIALFEDAYPEQREVVRQDVLDALSDLVGNDTVMLIDR